MKNIGMATKMWTSVSSCAKKAGSSCTNRKRSHSSRIPERSGKISHGTTEYRASSCKMARQGPAGSDSSPGTALPMKPGQFWHPIAPALQKINRQTERQTTIIRFHCHPDLEPASLDERVSGKHRAPHPGTP